MVGIHRGGAGASGTGNVHSAPRTEAVSVKYGYRVGAVCRRLGHSFRAGGDIVHHIEPLVGERTHTRKREGIKSLKNLWILKVEKLQL